MALAKSTQNTSTNTHNLSIAIDGMYIWSSRQTETQYQCAPPNTQTWEIDSSSGGSSEVPRKLWKMQYTLTNKYKSAENLYQNCYVREFFLLLPLLLSIGFVTVASVGFNISLCSCVWVWVCVFLYSHIVVAGRISSIWCFIIVIGSIFVFIFYSRITSRSLTTCVCGMCYCHFCHFPSLSHARLVDLPSFCYSLYFIFSRFFLRV